MKKAIKWIVLAFVLLIVGGIVVLFINLNSIIRSTVESQGTQQLQVVTKLGGVNLSIFGGSLALKDFSIGSPKGFSAEKMLELGDMKVGVSLGGIRGEPKHIGEITLNKPKLVIEQSGMNLNFKALMDQLPKSEPAPTPEPKTGEPAEPMKLVIDQINITGAEVVFQTSLLPQSLTIPIPDIALKGVGNENGNGAALRDVVMQVVTAMASAAANSDKIPPELRALLKGNIADVAGQLGGVAKEKIMAGMGNLGEGTTRAVGEVLSGKVPTTQNLGDAAGDLLKGFGDKKKDKK